MNMWMKVQLNLHEKVISVSKAEGGRNQRRNISSLGVSCHFKFNLKGVELITEHISS